ncbi:MAG TPA: glycosyltransferase, partial [Acidobacteriaceae bacterium]|nr:glycosyltransferase [Acidobacteriaceae bacterium]
MRDTLLSVVVIGRNEGARLERCLASIGKLRRAACEIEVIYVDSASTDGSPELARRAGAEAIVLDAVRPTAALGRNAGWQKAKGETILF